MLVEQHILHAPSDLQKSRKSSRRMDKIMQEECVQLDIIKYEIAAPLSIQDYTHTAPISTSVTPPTDNTLTMRSFLLLLCVLVSVASLASASRCEDVCGPIIQCKYLFVLYTVLYMYNVDVLVVYMMGPVLPELPEGGSS